MRQRREDVTRLQRMKRQRWRVPHGDIKDAYANFIKVFHDPSCDKGMGWQFWNFIKCTNPQQSYYNGDGSYSHDWSVPVESAEWVRAMRGPHYYAVMKAMKARGHRTHLEQPGAWKETMKG